MQTLEYIKDENNQIFTKKETIKKDNFIINLTKQYIYDPKSVNKGYNLLHQYAISNYINRD
jgi:hypothetical protein